MDGGAHQRKDKATAVVVLPLIHPNTNEPQHFIFSDKNIYEMNSVSRPYGSFFVGSRVISNGALHIATRMDPLYFVLHSLSKDIQQQKQKQNQWQPLDQLDIPNSVQEALCHDLNQYKHICSVKKLGDDLILYKYSQENAMKWLVKKQEQVLIILKQQLLHAKQENKASTQQLISQGGGAFSNTFHLVPDNDNDTNHSQNNNDNNNNDKSEVVLSSTELQIAKEQSVQVVCEYLSSEWQTKLLSHLNMTRVMAEHAPDADSNKASTSLKRSRECWETTTPGQYDADNLLQFTMGTGNHTKEEASAAKKQQAKTAGLKRLAKVNTKGMKTLSSFFGAPKKKKTNMDNNTKD
jgi:hypothetical protein